MRKLPDHEAKRHPLSLRTTLATRQRVEAAACANGRSIAQEVEARLERSFDRDDLRQIIREEIRAALDIKAARALGSSISRMGPPPIGLSIIHHPV